MTYLVSLGTYFLLVIGQTTWIVWLNPNSLAPKSIVLVFIVAPMLFFLRGLLNGKIKTYKAMTLFIWLYFIYGFWNVAEKTQIPLGILQIVGSVVLFTSCVLFVRQHRDVTSD